MLRARSHAEREVTCLGTATCVDTRRSGVMPCSGTVCAITTLGGWPSFGGAHCARRSQLRQRRHDAHTASTSAQHYITLKTFSLFTFSLFSFWFLSFDLSFSFFHFHFSFSFHIFVYIYLLPFTFTFTFPDVARACTRGTQASCVPESYGVCAPALVHSKRVPHFRSVLCLRGSPRRTSRTGQWW